MRIRRTAVLLPLLVALAALAYAQTRRAITEKDIFQFVWIGQPQVSPDGTRIVFVRVTVNDRKDGYDTQLYSMPTSGGEPQRLSSGKRDSSPRWSPDGKSLAFVRAPETEVGAAPGGGLPGGGGAAGAAGGAQVYILRMDGGEAQPLTHMPRGAGNPEWSPDGTRIAFTSGATTEEFNRAQQAERRQAAGGRGAGRPKGATGGEATPRENEGEGQAGNFNPEHRSDVRVITRAVYRANGAGYLDFTHPAHLWVVDVPASLNETPTPRQLTSGKFAESDAIWSKDGTLLYYTTNRVEEAYYALPTIDLFSVAAAGGQPPQKIMTFNFQARSLSLSPDGTRLALRGSRRVEPVQSHTEPDLWVVDLKPGAQPKNLTANFDADIGSGVGGDNAPPRAAGGSRPLWSADGRSILDVAAKEGAANLWRFDAETGAPTPYTSGKHDIDAFLPAGAGRLLLELSSPTMIGDLFLVDGAGSEARRVTDVNHHLFSQLNLTEPEEIWYTSFDGKRIQAWVQKPPDFDPGRKYPLILNIHGGPHAAYGWVFDHEFQWMAAKGYVVLYPNPRGSTSYGEAFANIIQYHYPGDDFRDLMLGVDEVLKKGYVDEKKLGVTGGSGGGLLTDWVVGHTDRFAAAVAQRDIANWADWWYSADFSQFQPSWFRGAPFDELEDFKARSPITYIKNVRTPLMLVLGEADFRTPPGAGGEQMFRALKALKRPVVMVRFPGESHELSRSGQPWHRVERLQNIVGWMDKYLQGKRVPQYDGVTGEIPPPAPPPPPAKKPAAKKP